MVQHVFIIGCKGIPAAYGGFETFVEKLTEYRSTKDIKYHVACAVEKTPVERELLYNGAECYRIKWKKVGSARAIFYDIDAANWALDYIKINKIKHPILYVLACRIGPWAPKLAKRVHAMGGLLFVNPDGHEWMRAKWSYPVQMYWRISESLMVRSADLLVCDSKSIQKYIQEQYKKHNPSSVYIAYGADTERSDLSDDNDKWQAWLKEHRLCPRGYYLIVGRFVPENNYETMISEFMKTNTKRSLVLVTKKDQKIIKNIEKRMHFSSDPRIKFVGTIYEQELLKKVRENAFAYLHGHEVGGTNPSLLEALASTDVNLLLDVGFNREVAERSSFYWTKKSGNLAKLIDEIDSIDIEMSNELGKQAQKRIKDYFSWNYIVEQYENLFMEGNVL